MNSSLVAIALEPKDDLVPPALKPGISQAKLVAASFSLIATTGSAAEIESKMSSVQGRRWAVGPEAIWEEFPELRSEFVLRIVRWCSEGRSIIEVRPGQLISGDVLADATVRLLTPSAQQAGHQLPDTFLANADELLRSYPVLGHMPSGLQLDVSDCRIFVCDDFSIIHDTGELWPGVYFLNPRQLIDHTNHAELLQENINQFSHMTGYTPPAFPDAFTGAILIREAKDADRNYSDATVGRILAAAAATTPVAGKVIVELRVSKRSWGYRRRWQERWIMPFSQSSSTTMKSGGSLFPQQRHTVVSGDDLFWTACDILSKGVPEKFESAKEDYRALALETIVDSRQSGVAALQFVQIWMAVERLLPFRTETTIQLALALPALVPKGERKAAFDNIIRSYRLRSDIAHGYNFKRTSTVYIESRHLAQVFRQLFRLSLRYSKSEELRSALVTHVLNGEESPIDAT